MHAVSVQPTAPSVPPAGGADAASLASFRALAIETLCSLMRPGQTSEGRRQAATTALRYLSQLDRLAHLERAAAQRRPANSESPALPQVQAPPPTSQPPSQPSPSAQTGAVLPVQSNSVATQRIPLAPPRIEHAPQIAPTALAPARSNGEAFSPAPGAGEDGGARSVTDGAPCASAPVSLPTRAELDSLLDAVRSTAAANPGDNPVAFPPALDSLPAINIAPLSVASDPRFDPAFAPHAPAILADGPSRLRETAAAQHRPAARPAFLLSAAGLALSG